MKLSIVAAATSQSVNVFILDSSKTDGSGLTGLVYNSAGLVAYYSFTGANAGSVAITLATLAAVNSAWSSGGFKEIDSTNMPGWYRLDLPNAALASGNGRVVSAHLKGATNMAPLPLEIELTGWDNQDGVHGGMSALPNTACTRNASLLTSGSGTDQLLVSAGKVSLVASDSPKFYSGTATAGGASTLTDTGQAWTANALAGCRVKITSGTGANQCRVIVSNTGTVLTVDRAWTTNPDATSVYTVLEGDSPKTDANLAVTAGTVSDKTGYSLTQAFPANFAALGITAGGHVSNVDTLTTYTGNTPQTGDGYAILNNGTYGNSALHTQIGSPQQVGTKYAVTLASTDVTGNLPADLQTIKTQTVTCSAAVTIEPFVGSVAAALVVDTSGRVDLVNAPNATALNAAADALLDRANAIETGITPRLAWRYVASTTVGVITDAGTGTEIYAGIGVATARVTATVDASGDRSAIVLS